MILVYGLHIKKYQKFQFILYGYYSDLLPISFSRTAVIPSSHYVLGINEKAIKHLLTYCHALKSNHISVEDHIILLPSQNIEKVLVICLPNFTFEN